MAGRWLEFELTTRWRIPARREQVFDAIAEPSEWPGWWPGVLETHEHAQGDAAGVGRSGEIVWRAPFGYRVRFEMTALRIERPELLEALAIGDLSGRGTWRFREADGGAATETVFEWHVSASKPLMRAGGPLLRPLLVWNHDRLMTRGERALAERLTRPRA